MKNVLNHSKKGFLMVAMFTTLLSFANDASFFGIENNAKRTLLTLNNLKEGNLLSIKDNNGIILFKELIQNDGAYKKEFDLTALPNGDYLFELDKDLEVNIIPFTVSSSLVTFNKEAEKVIYKPYTRMKDDTVYITKLALNKAPLLINIYFTVGDSEQELVHSEKIENTKSIEKAYKLSGLNKGKYKIVFHSDNRIFTKYIN